MDTVDPVIVRLVAVNAYAETDEWRACVDSVGLAKYDALLPVLRRINARIDGGT